jgi:hypothetical protein
MTKLLKKQHHGVIAQFCSLYVQTPISSTLVDIQIAIQNHSKVFGEMPKGLPLVPDHDHAMSVRGRERKIERG